MRSKTLGINVRVTEEEKEKLRQNRKVGSRLWAYSIGISAQIGAWKRCKSRNGRENLQDFSTGKTVKKGLELARKKRNSLSAQYDRGLTEIRK